MEKVGLQPEPRLSGTGTADDEDVLVPRVRGVLRTVGHHQVLRLREDDIVPEYRVLERGDVLLRPPSC